MTDNENGSLPPSETVEGGEDSFWTVGDKCGFATTYDHESADPRPVWFTLSPGALTEVRYPRIDMMNVRTVEFVVADPEEEYAVRSYQEYRGSEPRVRRETEMTSDDALSYRQRLTPTDEGRDWTLTVDYAVHPDHDAVLLDADFEADDGTAYDVYVTAELMLSCCGRHDIAHRREEDGEVVLTGYHTGDTWDDHVIVREEEVAVPVTDETGAEDVGGIGTSDVRNEGDGDPADSPERVPGEDEPIETDDDTGTGAAGTGTDTGSATTVEETPYLVSAALTSREGFEWGSVDIGGGKVHSSLLEAGVPDRSYQRAADHVLFFGRLGEGVQSLSDTVALGFGQLEEDPVDEGVESDPSTTADSVETPFAKDGEDAALAAARAALEDDFETVLARYERTWESYLDAVEFPDSVADSDELTAQYKSSVMTIKAADSKLFPGAGIASPSVPWGDTVQADEPADYGYSYVWARDLYQTFTAFEAAGDIESAIDATEYVYEHQQRETGFLPQNTFVDGRTRWGGEQLDEIAFPALMAQQLKARHGYGLEQAGYDYEHIARSAAYVTAHGPRSQQERWEEEGGYSPSTMAAEIAGLVAAADLAVDADERADALTFLGMADHWQAHLESWVATDTGAGGHEHTPYYVRISDEAKPNEHTMRTHNNAGGTYDEREVIDGGFLELVRLGVKPADDQVIRNSVREYDDTIMVETPNGPGWYRYSGDGYGEKDGSEWYQPGVPWSADMRGQGRLWPIFTGERGEYELLAGGEDFAPHELLETIQRFANEGRVLPEQVYDRDDGNPYGWEFGEGTSAATPLCWSNAQYVRLAHSIEAGEPVELPQVVRDRYVESTPAEPPALSTDIPESAGSSLTVTGRTDADEVIVRTRAETVRQSVTGERFTVDVRLEGEDRVIVVAATDDDPFDAGIAVAYDDVVYDPVTKTAGAARKEETSTEAAEERVGDAADGSVAERASGERM
jgi:glucan 1,4-alpha-glucosidase